MLNLNYVENFIMYHNCKYKGRGREASWKRKKKRLLGPFFIKVWMRNNLGEKKK